ncbi:hypothetical protein [Paenibacillus sp. 1001270B_150601_E10]|uniref:hypothetical protein n=1 Tax=Paenibacillus sp. 1001270B_150601_E10 TaxID=2787079 RepID=UPI00189E61EA|nr:hypothetical protein [Paenibacillus sp. 1001270B_150601_E10]
MEDMPGMLSTIIAVCVLILVLTGWRGILFDSVSPVLLLGGVLLWMGLAGRMVTMGPVKIDAAWALWLTVAIACGWDYFRPGRDSGPRLLLLSQMLILTCCYFILEMERYTGRGFIPIIPLWGYAILAGIVVGISTPSITGQWMFLTISLWIGEGLIQWRVTGMSGLELGSLSTFDVWWLAFILARCCTAAIMIFQQLFSLRSSE